MLIDEAKIFLPAPLSRGTLSPVSIDSSNAPSPSKITPSTGTIPPALTTKMSPSLILSIGTKLSLPSRSKIAFFGFSLIRLFSAFFVLPFENASSDFPTVIRTKIIPADSKYSPPCRVRSKKEVSLAFVHIEISITRLYPKETPEPRDTSVSILAAPPKSPLMPFTKNLLFIIIRASDIAICKNAKIRYWSAKNDGIKPKCPPIAKYISGTKSTSERVSIFKRWGVSLSLK